MGVLLLTILGLAALAALAYVHHQATLRRRNALAALSRQLGLRFVHEKNEEHHEQFGHALFKKGDRRAAYNTLRGDKRFGTLDCQVTMGDYTYSVGSGDDRETRTVSYVLIHLPFVGIPHLVIRPEDFGDKLVGLFSDADIDFESEEFSRRFHVESTDRQFAYAVVHPRMMEFLLGVKSPSLEITYDVCLLWNPGSDVWQPEEFQKRLWWAQEFLSLWPEHVMQDLTPRTRGRRAT